jgi:hypothetical protein
MRELLPSAIPVNDSCVLLSQQDIQYTPPRALLPLLLQQRLAVYPLIALHSTVSFLVVVQSDANDSPKLRVNDAPPCCTKHRIV